MYFNTLSSDYRVKQRKNDCIEINIKVPFSALERAIQEVSYTP
jgi:hypothetical protein